MSEFMQWFAERMANINYKLTGQMDNDECSWMKFADANDKFHVFYAKKPITPEIIRTTFAMENEPILFVVDMLLVPNVTNLVDDWHRALHAVYYGRIYTWDGHGIGGMHYDWLNNLAKYKMRIDVEQIRFERVESKLKAFPGMFFIANFGDSPFWKQEQPKQKKQPGEGWKERAKKQREEWEQATKGHAQGGYSQQSHNNPNYSNKDSDYEDLYEAFKRAFNEHMRNHGVDYDAPYVRRTPTGDKWFMMLVQTGSLAEARKKYKELAKKYHPNFGDNTTETESIMVEINNAFDKVKQYFE